MLCSGFMNEQHTFSHALSSLLFKERLTSSDGAGVFLEGFDPKPAE